jgi:hypothetical protein
MVGAMEEARAEATTEAMEEAMVEAMAEVTEAPGAEDAWLETLPRQIPVMSPRLEYLYLAPIPHRPEA